MDKAWTPITYTRKGTRLEAAVSGRVYRFDDSPFPSSIQVQGRELLQAPIRLRAQFGDVEREFEKRNLIIYEHDDEHLLFGFQEMAGSCIFNTRVRLEYDGLLWYSLSLMPLWGFSESKERLDGLKLEAPLCRELTELYHYWPGRESDSLPAPTVPNSGFLPEQGMELPFKPALWLGSEPAGLAWYAESDELFQPAGKVLEVHPGPAAATLRVRLLDSEPRAWQGKQDRWDEAILPITFSFGLQATPVKPYRKAEGFEHCYHMGCWQLEREETDRCAQIREIQSEGVKWLILHEDWSIIQNYGLPSDEADLKRLISFCHSIGLKVMLYFGYEFSTIAPDWAEHADQYLMKTPSGACYGGWQREPMQRDYYVCYAGGYGDTVLERVRIAMDEYGADGIYTDGTYAPTGCANAAHGCGYIAPDGARHVTYRILALREFVKRLQKLVHDRGGIIDAHQSSCCVPAVLGFCDFYHDGEHIQNLFQDNPDTFLDAGMLRSEFSGYNFGVPIQFLLTPTEGHDFLECCGTPLLNGVLSRPERDMTCLRQAASIWRALEKFGADEAEFHPFWKPGCPVRAGLADVRVSVWEKAGRMLAVCVNSSREAVSAELELERPARAACRHPEGETPILSEDGKHIEMKLPPLRPQFIEIVEGEP